MYQLINLYKEREKICSFLVEERCGVVCVYTHCWHLIVRNYRLEKSKYFWQVKLLEREEDSNLLEKGGTVQLRVGIDDTIIIPFLLINP